MSKYNKEYFGNDRWQVVPDSAASAGPTLFTIVFVSGIVIFILILIGRQAFNWYVKHNAMLDELGRVRTESEKTNSVLKSIQRQLKQFRRQMHNKNEGEEQRTTGASMARSMRRQYRNQ